MRGAMRAVPRFPGPPEHSARDGPDSAIRARGRRGRIRRRRAAATDTGRRQGRYEEVRHGRRASKTNQPAPSRTSRSSCRRCGIRSELPIPGFGVPGRRRRARRVRPMPARRRPAVPESGGDVRGARPRRDRAQDRRVEGHRRLAADEPQHDADQHQDDGVAKGVARGAARRPSAKSGDAPAARRKA